MSDSEQGGTTSQRSPPLPQAPALTPSIPPPVALPNAPNEPISLKFPFGNFVRSSQWKDANAHNDNRQANSQFWHLYKRHADYHDARSLNEWNDSMDTLLIFAALFSAVVTAFLIEAYKTLEPDFTEWTYRRLTNDTFVGAEPFQPPNSARAVNCLWTAALIFSLFTSLFCILAKQWLLSYRTGNRDNLREWSLIRQYRYNGVSAWNVPDLIAWLPVLLHASLLMFLAGLVVLLLDIDGPTSYITLALSIVVLALYIGTLFAPVFWPSSPFRTQLTPVLTKIWDWGMKFIHISTLFRSWTPRWADDPWHKLQHQQTSKLTASALSWLSALTNDDSVDEGVFNELGDATDGLQVYQNLSLPLQHQVLRTWSTVRDDIRHYCRTEPLTLQQIDEYFRAVVTLDEAGQQPESVHLSGPNGPQVGSPPHDLSYWFRSWYYAQTSNSAKLQIEPLLVAYWYLIRESEQLLLEPPDRHEDFAKLILRLPVTAHNATTFLLLLAETAPTITIHYKTILLVFHAWQLYQRTDPRSQPTLLADVLKMTLFPGTRDSFKRRSDPATWAPPNYSSVFIPLFFLTRRTVELDDTYRRMLVEDLISACLAHPYLGEEVPQTRTMAEEVMRALRVHYYTDQTEGFQGVLSVMHAWRQFFLQDPTPFPRPAIKRNPFDPDFLPSLIRSMLSPAARTVLDERRGCHPQCCDMISTIDFLLSSDDHTFVEQERDGRFRKMLVDDLYYACSKHPASTKARCVVPVLAKYPHPHSPTPYIHPQSVGSSLGWSEPSVERTATSLTHHTPPPPNWHGYAQGQRDSYYTPATGLPYHMPPPPDSQGYGQGHGDNPYTPGRPDAPQSLHERLDEHEEFNELSARLVNDLLSGLDFSTAPVIQSAMLLTNLLSTDTRWHTESTNTVTVTRRPAALQASADAAVSVIFAAMEQGITAESVLMPWLSNGILTLIAPLAPVTLVSLVAQLLARDGPGSLHLLPMFLAIEIPLLPASTTVGHANDRKVDESGADAPAFRTWDLARHFLDGTVALENRQAHETLVISINRLLQSLHELHRLDPKSTNPPIQWEDSMEIIYVSVKRALPRLPADQRERLSSLLNRLFTDGSFVIKQRAKDPQTWSDITWVLRTTLKVLPPPSNPPLWHQMQQYSFTQASPSYGLPATTYSQAESFDRFWNMPHAQWSALQVANFLGAVDFSSGDPLVLAQLLGHIVTPVAHWCKSTSLSVAASTALKHWSSGIDTLLESHTNAKLGCFPIKDPQTLQLVVSAIVSNANLEPLTRRLFWAVPVYPGDEQGQVEFNARVRVWQVLYRLARVIETLAEQDIDVSELVKLFTESNAMSFDGTEVVRRWSLTLVVRPDWPTPYQMGFGKEGKGKGSSTNLLATLVRLRDRWPELSCWHDLAAQAEDDELNRLTTAWPGREWIHGMSWPAFWARMAGKQPEDQSDYDESRPPSDGKSSPDPLPPTMDHIYNQVFPRFRVGDDMHPRPPPVYGRSRTPPPVPPMPILQELPASWHFPPDAGSRRRQGMRRSTAPEPTAMGWAGANVQHGPSHVAAPQPRSFAFASPPEPNRVYAPAPFYVPLPPAPPTDMMFATNSIPYPAGAGYGSRPPPPTVTVVLPPQGRLEVVADDLGSLAEDKAVGPSGRQIAWADSPTEMNRPRDPRDGGEEE